MVQSRRRKSSKMVRSRRRKSSRSRRKSSKMGRSRRKSRRKSSKMGRSQRKSRRKSRRRKRSSAWAVNVELDELVPSAYYIPSVEEERFKLQKAKQELSDEEYRKLVACEWSINEAADSIFRDTRASRLSAEFFEREFMRSTSPQADIDLPRRISSYGDWDLDRKVKLVDTSEFQTLVIKVNAQVDRKKTRKVKINYLRNKIRKLEKNIQEMWATSWLQGDVAPAAQLWDEEHTESYTLQPENIKQKYEQKRQKNATKLWKLNRELTVLQFVALQNGLTEALCTGNVQEV